MAQKTELIPTPPKRPFSIKSTGIMDTHTNVVYEYSKEDILMISPKGVVTIYENKVDFITTERWEEEYNYHCKLIRIPFFIRFNLWKPFYVWHSKVQAKKIHSVKESLQRRLCIVNEVCHRVYEFFSIYVIRDSTHYFISLLFYFDNLFK